MEFNIQPRMADDTLFEGEGGGYYSWSSAKFPYLAEANVAAGKLVLHPRGFALPHYADSTKIGYVIQGSCTVGMLTPNTSEEKVMLIKKGDAIPVPLGAVSWWFNGGDSEVVTIIFLGETCKAHIPGQITYFLLAGTLGILNGFSTEFIQRAYNFNEQESTKLTKSQPGVLIIKLEKGFAMPQPSKDCGDNFFTNINNGGRVGQTSLTEENFDLLGKIELSGNFVKLNSDTMLGPMYAVDASVRIVYVVKGSGKVQIVGRNGKSVLDTKVQEGDLFVVPKFFVVAEIAGEDGMECFSVITSAKYQIHHYIIYELFTARRPMLGQLAGNTSVWKAISPMVLQASLNVSSEFVKLFKQKI